MPTFATMSETVASVWPHIHLRANVYYAAFIAQLLLSPPTNEIKKDKKACPDTSDDRFNGYIPFLQRFGGRPD